MLTLCSQWEFVPNRMDAFMLDNGSAEAVRLPHNVNTLPLHYADHNSDQMVCGYRRKLTVTDEMMGQRLFLQFDGAAHVATVYVNSTELAHHRCGYTAFRLEITDAVHTGENIVAVKLDTTENPEIPLFGFMVDYLTYGGLYREAWLDVRKQSLISDLYITTPTTESLHLEVAAEQAEGCVFLVEIINEENSILLKTYSHNAVLDCVHTRRAEMEYRRSFSPSFGRKQPRCLRLFYFRPFLLRFAILFGRIEGDFAILFTMVLQ